MSSDHGQPVRASDDHVAERPLPTSVTISRPRAANRARSLPHGRKFVVATAALVAVAVAALAGAIVVAVNTGTSRLTIASASWSAWRPADGGLQGAQEIADFVAPYYRATAADQLAVVTVTNLNNPANPVQVVVPAPSSTGSFLPLPPSSTIVYNLCGVGGKDCSIGVGQPSAARLLLLRREALELALYTFRYVGGTQTVVAILPPGHTVVGCTGICAKPPAKPAVKPLDLAVAFDRAELAAYLAQPLRATLPGLLPPNVSQMSSAPEAPLVSVITAHGMFSENTQQGQDGSTMISLSPLPPQ